MARQDRREIVPEPDEEYTRDEVWPLRSIWDNEPEINTVSSYRQLEDWGSPKRREKNDFPEPAEMVGRFAFYSPEMVLKWHKLWKKAHKNYRKPPELVEEEKNRAKR